MYYCAYISHLLTSLDRVYYCAYVKLLTSFDGWGISIILCLVY